MKSQMPEGKGVPGVATRPVGNRGLPVLHLGPMQKIEDLRCWRGSDGRSYSTEGSNVLQKTPA